MTKPQFILPDWPAPKNVRAAVTTRIGGASHAPYDTFNLATHVGDDPAAVYEVTISCINSYESGSGKDR